MAQHLPAGEPRNPLLTANRAEVHRFLTAVYGGKTGLLQICSAPNNWSGSSFATDPEGINNATTYVMTLDANNAEGIYARVTTLASVPTARGKAEDSYAFLGFWADIDFGTEGHKDENNPPDAKSAEQLYRATGLPAPSILVNSGGGLYPYVLLREQIDVRHENTRKRIAELSRRWQAHIENTARAMGYSYGRGVSDLARVLRIPGTVNRKTDTPRMAQVRYYEHRYSLEELEDSLPAPQEKRSAAPGGRIGASRTQDSTGRLKELLRGVRRGATAQEDLRVLVDAFRTNYERDGGRNNALSTLAGAAFQYAANGQLDADEVKELFTEAAYELEMDEDGAESIENTLKSAEEYGRKNPRAFEERRTPDGAEMLPAPSDPMAVARALMSARSVDGVMTLRHFNGTWTRWDGPHWSVITESALRAEIYPLLEGAVYLRNGTPELWMPNRHKMADLIEALEAVCHLPEATESPSWLTGPGSGPGSGPGKAATFSQVVHVGPGSPGVLEKIPIGPVVACADRLLDVRTRTPLSLTPRYFNRASVPFDYDPEAKAPEWLKFLNSLWAEDPGAIQTLQEWFGYVLSGRTDLQKMLFLVGQTRSGKGTIARIMRALLGGTENVADTSTAALAEGFGLGGLIGKTLAILPDVRAGKDGVERVMERLLSISGEDSISVQRKYRDDWMGQLPARFMLLSNDLIPFRDASGAFQGRLVTLVLTRSFLGKEDTGLEGRLRNELAGILNWALEGLDRLTERGRFIEPDSSSSATTFMKSTASPIQEFLDDCCEVGPGLRVPREDLFAAWQRWCFDNGHQPGAAANLGRLLFSVLQSAIGDERPSVPKGQKRVRYYTGIALTESVGSQLDKQLAALPGPLGLPAQTPPRHLDHFLDRGAESSPPAGTPVVGQTPLTPCEACGEQMAVMTVGQTRHPSCPQEAP